MADLATIKKLRDEHFKDEFILGDIVKTPNNGYGYICGFFGSRFDDMVQVNTGKEDAIVFDKQYLEKVNEEESPFDTLDRFNVGDIVTISHDLPVDIKGIKKTVERGSNAIITEKLEKGVRIQGYAGDDLVFVNVYDHFDYLSKLGNIKIVAGLKTQLTSDGNSDGYSSPLAEMLEKEKEEERTIEKMPYFEGNTTYEKEKIPHVKRLFLMRKVVDGEPVWGWFMENGKFYPRKEI